MSFVNGVEYDISMFDADGYARNFEALVGDVYQHLYRQWNYTVTGWSSATVLQVEDWNQGTWPSLPTVGIGSFVCIYSKANYSTNRVYGQVNAISLAYGNWSVTIDVTALIGATPNTLPSIRDWVMIPTGIQTVAPTGTLAQAVGGTAATTQAAAVANLGLISPTTSLVLSDDFVGYGVDYDTNNPVPVPRKGLFCALSGTVNFRAHSDASIMGRFPEIDLSRHPGLLQQYVVSNGDVAKVGMQNPILQSGGQIAFDGPCSMEWMFKIKGSGGVLPTTGWSLKIGVSNDLNPATYEIGIGIRPNTTFSSDGNVFVMYSIVAGVTTFATGGYTGNIDDEPYYYGAWWKLQLLRTASGSTLTGFLYGYDEDGNQFLTASLGSIAAANLPSNTISLTPLCELRKTLAISGYVEMLSDYAQIQKKFTR